MYRRNSSDAQLRDLERSYDASPDPIVLRQIDSIRHRQGMAPHPATRLRVADDQLHEANYQCFNIIRDIHPRLEQLVNIPPTPQIVSWNLDEFVPLIERTLEMRRMADNEIMSTVGGRPPERAWVAFLKERGIKLPKQGKLPKAAEVSMMPHMSRSGAADRLTIGSTIRNELDTECYLRLNTLVRLGIFNAHALMVVFEDDDEEVRELILNIEVVLTKRDACYEETLLADARRDPRPFYAEHIGADHWWRHLER